MKHILSVYLVGLCKVIRMENEIIKPKDKYQFNILKDTREKDGSWYFVNHRNVKLLIETKLPTGDYSIQGLENLLTIERKKSICELAGNFTQDRFKNELVRMESFKYKFIICEFDYKDVVEWPISSKLPNEKLAQIRTSSKYLMRYISEIQVIHGIQILFCGDRHTAEWSASNVMRRVYEQEQKSE